MASGNVMYRWKNGGSLTPFEDSAKVALVRLDEELS